MITYVRAIIACHRYMRAYDSKTGVIHRSHTVFHHRTYIRIYYASLLRHNNVIFNVRLCPHVVVCSNI